MEIEARNIVFVKICNMMNQQFFTIILLISNIRLKHTVYFIKLMVSIFWESTDYVPIKVEHNNFYG